MKSEAHMALPRNRKEYIEGFIAQINLSKLSPDVAETVVSIADQFQATGDVTERQYQVLRRCSLATCERRMKLNYSWQGHYQGFRG
jgi:hypothetical protein